LSDVIDLGVKKISKAIQNYLKMIKTKR